MQTVRTVQLSGFKELEAALAELPRATAKNTGIRTLKKAAKPVDEAASANAPEMTGKLETSVIVGTKLTRRQRTRTPRGVSKDYVEVHIGTSLARGLFTEFGTYKDPAQMWFSRAWGATQDEALRIITEDLAGEIEKSAQRLARKRGTL